MANIAVVPFLAPTPVQPAFVLDLDNDSDDGYWSERSLLQPGNGDSPPRDDEPSDPDTEGDDETESEDGASHATGPAAAGTSAVLSSMVALPLGVAAGAAGAPVHAMSAGGAAADRATTGARRAPRGGMAARRQRGRAGGLPAASTAMIDMPEYASGGAKGGPASDPSTAVPVQPSAPAAGDATKPRPDDAEWVSEVLPFDVPPFTSASGPSPALAATLESAVAPEPVRPVDIFRQLFSSSMLRMVIEETNRYATQLCAMEPPPGRAQQWPPSWAASLKQRPVDLKEMGMFVGVSLGMGVHGMALDGALWSKHFLFENRLSSVMSKERFLAIQQSLHLVNNQARESQIQPDGYFKVSAFLETFRQNITSRYTVGEHVNLAELSLEQAAKRRGGPAYKSEAAAKVYCLTETRTGYTWNFHLDRRDGTSVRENVVKLCEGLAHKHHKLYLDEVFTSTRTIRELLDIGVLAVGAAAVHRGVPSAIAEAHARPMRSDWVWRMSPPSLLAVACNDSTHTVLLSSFHKPTEYQGSRRLPAAPGRAHQSVPAAAVEYYDAWTVAEHAEPARAAFSTARRSRKWWHAVWFWVLDVSVLNSQVIWNACFPDKRMTHMQFIAAVTEGLCDASARTPAPSAPLKRKRFSGGPAALIAQGAKPGEHMPDTEFKRQKCKVCYAEGRRKDTHSICRSCEIHVCIGHCWRVLHGAEAPAVTAPALPSVAVVAAAGAAGGAAPIATPLPAGGPGGMSVQSTAGDSGKPVAT